MARVKEVEADGFITREEDISPQNQTCNNCRWYQYSLITKIYVCMQGYTITDNDWRKKYNVCDKWGRINDRYWTNSKNVQRYT